MLLRTVCINGTQTNGTKFDLNPLKRTDGKWEVQNVPGRVTFKSLYSLIIILHSLSLNRASLLPLLALHSWCDPKIR